MAWDTSSVIQQGASAPGSTFNLTSDGTTLLDGIFVPSGTTTTAAPTTAAPFPLPRNLTLTPTTTTIVCDWDNSPGATDYEVYYSTDPNLTRTTKDGVNPYPSPNSQAGVITNMGGSNLLITGLTPNTTYYIKIAAVYSGGTSGLTGGSSTQTVALTTTAGPTTTTTHGPTTTAGPTTTTTGQPTTTQPTTTGIPGTTVAPAPPSWTYLAKINGVWTPMQLTMINH